MTQENPFSLVGKVAIVTGSGTGIGKAIALELARAGADIAVVEIDSKSSESTASEVKTIGRRVLEVVGDIQERRQVDHLIQRTLGEFGGIDILVNNVGGLTKFEPLIEMSEETWDGVFRLNVKTAFMCSQAVGRVMIEKKAKGSIVNLSSIAASSNRPDIIHYGAAKGAISSFTHGLAREWARYGIRVNAIAPGFVETPLRDKVYKDQPELLKRRLSMIPMGRMASPSEMATVAVFLASEAASYVTGQTILVAGGLDTTVEPMG